MGRIPSTCCSEQPKKGRKKRAIEFGDWLLESCGLEWDSKKDQCMWVYLDDNLYTNEVYKIFRREIKNN